MSVHFKAISVGKEIGASISGCRYLRYTSLVQY